MTLRPRKKLIQQINHLENQLYAEAAYVERCKQALIQSLKAHVIIIDVICIVGVFWILKHIKIRKGTMKKVTSFVKEIAYILIMRVTTKAMGATLLTTR